MRFRKVGTVRYTNVSSLTTTFLTVSDLSAGTSYEWQVRSQCDGNVLSDFSPTSSFATQICSAPYGPYVSSQGASVATVSWNFYGSSADTRFEMRYRVVDTPDWTTISQLPLTPVTSSYGSYTLTALTPDKSYELQIRTICSVTDNSAFSNSALFSTCSQPYTVRAGLWYETTVWSCNRVPNATDTVQIKHVVTVPANYTATAGTVQYDPGQQLIFQAGATLRLGQ